MAAVQRLQGSVVASRAVSRTRCVAVRAQVGTAVRVSYVKPNEVKSLVENQGYAFWDIRTPEEHGEAYKAYFKNVPFAIIARNGPQINPDFMRTFQRVFTDKNAKVILACDDGRDRSEMAFERLAAQGYNNLKVVDGGIWAILDVDPMNAKDRQARKMRR